MNVCDFFPDPEHDGCGASSAAADDDGRGGSIKAAAEGGRGSVKAGAEDGGGSVKAAAEDGGGSVKAGAEDGGGSVKAAAGSDADVMEMTGDATVFVSGESTGTAAGAEDVKSTSFHLSISCN